MADKCRFHELHKILPGMDLEKYAESAFKGADYHLTRAKHLAAEGKEQYGQFNSNQFLWEVRAFFWELAASYDITLQWANQEFNLGIPEHKVTYEKVLKATPPQADNRWQQVRKLLEDAGSSNWHFEVQAYRSFNIHCAFTSTEAVVAMPEPSDATAPIDPGRLVALQITPAREGQQWGGDLFKYLDSYIDAMADLGRKLFVLEPSSDTPYNPKKDTHTL